MNKIQLRKLIRENINNILSKGEGRSFVNVEDKNSIMKTVLIDKFTDKLKKRCVGKYVEFYSTEKLRVTQKDKLIRGICDNIDIEDSFGFETIVKIGNRYFPVDDSDEIRVKESPDSLQSKVINPLATFMGLYSKEIQKLNEFLYKNFYGKTVSFKTVRNKTVICKCDDIEFILKNNGQTQLIISDKRELEYNVNYYEDIFVLTY